MTDAGDWSGDTPLTFDYEWEQCDANGDGCVAIAGATARTYVLTAADTGKTVRVEVTATNAAGAASADSDLSGVVAAPGDAPAASAPPIVVGTAQQGKTLTAVTAGTWHGATPMTFAYQWQRCTATGGGCADVAGATGQTYSLDAADVGHRLRAAVVATNGSGSGKAYSDATTAATAADAPSSDSLPTITGAARQGEALTASTGSWSGTQPITFAYQWQRCSSAGGSCTAIAGATAATYTLSAADVGATLRVAITASNSAGSAAALSSPSAVVASPGTAPANTSAPTIAGSAEQGAALNASPGNWNGTAPISFAYTWQRCDAHGNDCATITSATSYTATVADVGHRLRLAVTGSNAAGSSTAYSGTTAVVAALAPVSTARPTVSGKAETGETLTAAPGSWIGAAPTSFFYQWARSNSKGGYDPIPGATAKTYTLTSADAGHRLFVQVKAMNRYGAQFVNSEPTGVVSTNGAPRNTVLPAIGGTARVGTTLTLSTGSWTTPTALTSVTQRWQRCDTNGNNCTPIAGAYGRSYTLTNGDQGHTLRAIVTAANAAGSTTATSRQTAVVATAAANVKVPSSVHSIAVANVALPDRLVISGVSFQPSLLRSRAPFTARIRVTDSHGNAVQGALVYAVGLPFGRVAKTEERATGTDGWVTIQLVPTTRLPLRNGGSLVFFVRARKPGDSLLAGVSTRRLVQVRLGAPR